MPYQRKRPTLARRVYCRPWTQFYESSHFGSIADTFFKSNENSVQIRKRTTTNRGTTKRNPNSEPCHSCRVMPSQKFRIGQDTLNLRSLFGYFADQSPASCEPNEQFDDTTSHNFASFHGDSGRKIGRKAEDRSKSEDGKTRDGRQWLAKGKSCSFQHDINMKSQGKGKPDRPSGGTTITKQRQ